MGRTSIPCSDATRDILLDLKPDGTTWDEFLQSLIDEETLSERNEAELAEQISSLRREFDEFSNRLPRQVAEELQH